MANLHLLFVRNHLVWVGIKDRREKLCGLKGIKVCYGNVAEKLAALAEINLLNNNRYKSHSATVCDCSHPFQT